MNNKAEAAVAVVVAVVVGGVFCTPHLQAAPVKEKMTKQLKSSATSKTVSIALQMSETDARSRPRFQLLGLYQRCSFVFPAPVPRLDSLHDDYLFFKQIEDDVTCLSSSVTLLCAR